jgi:hypothetical protein
VLIILDVGGVIIKEGGMKTWASFLIGFASLILATSSSSASVGPSYSYKFTGIINSSSNNGYDFGSYGVNKIVGEKIDGILEYNNPPPGIDGSYGLYLNISINNGRTSLLSEYLEFVNCTRLGCVTSDIVVDNDKIKGSGYRYENSYGYSVGDQASIEIQEKSKYGIINISYYDGFSDLYSRNFTENFSKSIDIGFDLTSISGTGVGVTPLPGAMIFYLSGLIGLGILKHRPLRSSETKRPLLVVPPA